MSVRKSQGNISYGYTGTFLFGLLSTCHHQTANSILTSFKYFRNTM